MKSRSSAMAVIVAVLLFGCLLGMAGYHFWGRGLQPHSALSNTQRTQGHTGRLTSRLKLTEEQEAQLKVILEDSRRQINASRMEWDLKLQDIRTKTNERIAAILNEEQRKNFRQLIKDADPHGRSTDQGHGHGDH